VNAIAPMSLADLAARIKVEHEAATGAFKRSIEHAIAAGELLIEAKKRLEHGEFGPWLASHGIPSRTARLYMRLAKNRPIIEAQNGNVADLSLRGALEILTNRLPDFDALDSELYGTGLIGESLAPKPQGALADQYGVPPISVLDARSGAWQSRKRAWIALGIRSELGRGEAVSPTAGVPRPDAGLWAAQALKVIAPARDWIY
jgi:hypothetical protein